MSSFGTVDGEKISIKGVRIIRASIDHPSDGMFLSVKGFKTDVAFKTAFNLDDKLAKAELEVRIETDSDFSEMGTCEYNIHFIFHVDNLNQLVKLENDELIVSASLQNTLASVSYSTTRGMLLDRLQNTVFQDFILPVINPGKLIHA